MALYKSFHNPIFQGMEADHGKPATNCESSESLRQPLLQLLELLIDKQAKSQKSARRRMLVFWLERQRLDDQIAQLRRRHNRRFTPGLHNQTRDTPGKTLFAILIQNPGQLGLVDLGQPG